MHTSTAGIELIKKSEGFSASVYSDVAGFKTVGYGHKLQSGESFPSDVTVTQATSLLMADVAVAEGIVHRLVKVPLTQGQFDALVDFVFNLGGGRLASSTLLRDLNAGKYDAAGQQLLLWDHSGGVVVAGLKTRREAELQLWLEPKSS
jgi:lysozyme